jgi:DNA-binding HxlR family transcriptional regulator
MVRKEDVNIIHIGCPPYVVLSLIASKWTVVVLHALQNDTKRYNEIMKAIPGITQKVLTDTLRKLERDGIIERIVYPVVPPKVEYKLTKLGSGLLAKTEMIAAWAEENIDQVNSARQSYDERAAKLKRLVA